MNTADEMAATMVAMVDHLEGVAMAAGATQPKAREWATGAVVGIAALITAGEPYPTGEAVEAAAEAFGARQAALGPDAPADYRTADEVSAERAAHEASLAQEPF